MLVITIAAKHLVEYSLIAIMFSELYLIKEPWVWEGSVIPINKNYRSLQYTLIERHVGSGKTEETHKSLNNYQVILHFYLENTLTP